MSNDFRGDRPSLLPVIDASGNNSNAVECKYCPVSCYVYCYVLCNVSC